MYKVTVVLKWRWPWYLEYFVVEVKGLTLSIVSESKYIEPA